MRHWIENESRWFVPLRVTYIRIPVVVSIIYTLELSNKTSVCWVQISTNIPNQCIHKMVKLRKFCQQTAHNVVCKKKGVIFCFFSVCNEHVKTFGANKHTHSIDLSPLQLNDTKRKYLSTHKLHSTLQRYQKLKCEQRPLQFPKHGNKHSKPTDCSTCTTFPRSLYTESLNA